MKFAADRPWSDPEKAARRIVEIANSVEAVQDGRIHIEKINGPFLFREKGTPAEYQAGLNLAIERGWLEAARERHVRPVHANRRRSVRLNVIRSRPLLRAVTPLAGSAAAPGCLKGYSLPCRLRPGAIVTASTTVEKTKSPPRCAGDLPRASLRAVLNFMPTGINAESLPGRARRAHGHKFGILAEVRVPDALFEFYSQWE